MEDNRADQDKVLPARTNISQQVIGRQQQQ